MAKSFGEPLKKLRAVPIKDNGEKLMDPRNLSKRIHKAEKHPVMTDDLSRSILVRESLGKKLAEAAEKLPSSIDMVVFEGFRPIELQRQNNEWVRKIMTEKYPTWRKAALQRKINEFSAPADDKCPPPHLTGGAVDLYLVDNDGKILDFFSPYETWGTDSAETSVKKLSKIAKKNRELLIETLTFAGLTNYVGEWWHWSYGDSGWALRTGSSHAIYDRLIS